jgi:hypothetical protein
MRALLGTALVGVSPICSWFMVFAPLEGWRLVKVTDRHTAIDYAHMLRDLSDVHFPDAYRAGAGQSQHP